MNESRGTPVLSQAEKGKSKANRLFGQVLDLFGEGKYSDAIPIAQNVVDLHRQIYGNESPLLGTPLMTLGYLYVLQERYEEAEPVLLEAVKSNGKRNQGYRKFGVHRESISVGSSLNVLGLLYIKQERYKKAEPLLMRALDIFQEDHNYDRNLIDPARSQSFYVSGSLEYLGFLKIKQERYKEAENLLQQALRLRKKSLDSDHPHIASNYVYLGDLHHAQGRYSEAKSLYLNALKIYKHRFHQDHPDTQNLLHKINELPHGIKVLPSDDLGL